MSGGGDYFAAAEREVAQWPGVRLRFENTSKHRKAVVSFAGAERFVVFPMSPSDSRRGVANFLSDLRGELRTIGAARSVRAFNGEAKRTTHRPRPARPIVLPSISDPRPDGFAALRELQQRMQAEPPVPPPRAPWWRSILNAFRSAA